MVSEVGGRVGAASWALAACIESRGGQIIGKQARLSGVMLELRGPCVTDKVAVGAAGALKSLPKVPGALVRPHQTSHAASMMLSAARAAEPHGTSAPMDAPNAISTAPPLADPTQGVANGHSPLPLARAVPPTSAGPHPLTAMYQYPPQHQQAPFSHAYPEYLEVVVKAKVLQHTIRMKHVVQGKRGSYVQLLSKFAARLRASPDQIKLEYIDDQNDTIMMCCDDDLVDCIQLAQLQSATIGPLLIKIVVTFTAAQHKG
ncbi:hypothetical protein CYMTET_33266 [Cymbomonas tetramitiformis]|uniref:PB1 domain-containing protein n=1 Tax=Cymbomonas tetramitiformis TaxID=36881 RepID=A0AAE0KRD1_9CHLO|nr:hypothetical protein CYMTET_33266 [Cymbomonas tetramitiformis]